ncbi:ATP-dependent metallopeptidase FtsH/Yme1/Tma family protein, partial [Candidatus Woesebacteria bacterium]|nr:ATP-dependent metallopeptidase FtsH/Yme1/Tma family protein [Candidatus Woesebacteria bacterium]
MKGIKDLKKLGKEISGGSVKTSKDKGRTDKDPKKKGKKKKRVEVRLKINLWKVIIGGLLFIFFFPFILQLFNVPGIGESVETSEAMMDIKKGRVSEVTVQNEKFILEYNDGSIKTATKEEGESFNELLVSYDIDPSEVNYTVTDQTLAKAIAEILSIVLPLGLMALFFFFIFRAQTKGAQDIFS